MRSLKLRFPSGAGDTQGAGHALLVLGIMALAGVLYQFNAVMHEVDYWNGRIASMDRRMQRTVEPGISAERASPEKKREMQKANLVMSEIDLPWEALFDSVEHASRPDVALLSFQPNPANRTLRIGGEAKDIPSMLEFVRALEREAALKDAHLLRHEVKRDNPQQPVVFLLIASWT